VLAKLKRNLLERFPGVRLVGSAGPFGDQTALDAVVAEICETEPHVVWCAFGAPKQELWMHRNAAALAPALVLGVGAAFDYHAGTKKRAPVWMQRAGLEWLHRLAAEPRRLGRRYLATNTAFCVLVAREGLRGRLRRPISSCRSSVSPEADPGLSRADHETDTES
jgi:N-acetylglucosaminyldiphosphoundecaprenol N-acetyl-beta-D-mannosaminyltransferase